MRSRYTLLFPLAFVLAACGTPYSQIVRQEREAAAAQARAQAAADSAFAVRQARADSLLSLPPDSLSATDLQWLQLYYQDRERADREATTAAARESMSNANKWIVASLGFSALLAFIYFMQADAAGF